jgi:hypothetical protein
MSGWALFEDWKFHGMRLSCKTGLCSGNLVVRESRPVEGVGRKEGGRPRKPPSICAGGMYTGGYGVTRGGEEEEEEKDGSLTECRCSDRDCIKWSQKNLFVWFCC